MVGDVGARQVVDGDVVGTAQGVEVDLLEAVEVHRDVADIASEADAASVGRDVDVFIGVGAVEDHGVVAVLTLDDVGAVTGIPDEGVVAGAEEDRVVSTTAVDRCRCRRRR